MSLFPNLDVFATPKPESLIERIIHIATNPGDLVVDIFGGSGTTATTAHKMRRRWVIAERNCQTVADYIIPRLQRVIGGSDPDGVTESNAWLGGGGFELVHVPARFGSSPKSDTFKTLIKRLDETALKELRLQAS
jgi:adenine-specific DNA-methyltransferase